MQSKPRGVAAREGRAVVRQGGRTYQDRGQTADARAKNKTLKCELKPKQTKKLVPKMRVTQLVLINARVLVHTPVPTQAQTLLFLLHTYVLNQLKLINAPVTTTSLIAPGPDLMHAPSLDQL